MALIKEGFSRLTQNRIHIRKLTKAIYAIFSDKSTTYFWTAGCIGF